MVQNFSMHNISLNIGNHLKALPMIQASRDSSFPFMSSSCLCISLRLWICVSCCFCICCIWLCNFSILVSRFEILPCSFSLACSSSFSFPLLKREATPLVMAVVAVVAVFLSLSVRIFNFTCLSSCPARFTCCSVCRFAAFMCCSSAFCFSMIKSFRSRCFLPVTAFDCSRGKAEQFRAEIRRMTFCFQAHFYEFHTQHIV